MNKDITLKQLFKSWKFISIWTGSVALISVFVVLVIPISFKSTTLLLPPVDDSNLLNFSSIISDLPLKALGLGSGVSPQADLFLAILKSRRLLVPIAHEFELEKKYNTKNIEETLKELRKHISVLLEDEGTIAIGVDAKTKWFCAFNSKEQDRVRTLAFNMTTFLTKELDVINRELRFSNAHNTCSFIENRYLENVSDLTQAENNYNAYQKKYGVIALPEQITATIEAVAELKALIIEKDVAMNVLQNYVGTNHTDYLKLKLEKDVLTKKYRQLEHTSGSQDHLLIGLESVPDLGLKHARLFREVFLQEKIMEFLLPQYEQAKIQKSRNTPMVEFLDKPNVPFKKFKPKRAVIVIFYTLLGFIASVLFIYFKPILLMFRDEFISSER